MHKITDRKTHLPFDPSKPFLGFEGHDICARCVLATTRWDQVENGRGLGYESELKKTWKPMLDCGSGIIRFDGKAESAQSVVSDLLDRKEKADKLANTYSALTLGRCVDQSVIVLVGVTGHEKSTIINRLVGHEIVQVATTSESSTTTVIPSSIGLPAMTYT
jgi:hypothetical protein